MARRRMVALRLGVALLLFAIAAYLTRSLWLGALGRALVEDDGPAKAEVTAILREFGWEAPIDIGGIDGARWLEAFVPLWVRIAQAANTWTPAIKVLRK